MNKIEMNIGLNNNPCTAQEIVSVLASSFGSLKHNVQIGEWDGANEPTLVIEVLVEYEYFRIKPIVARLVHFLTQDAIAFRFNGDGELVFNDSYTGERYPFDEKYFLTIK